MEREGREAELVYVVREADAGAAAIRALLSKLILAAPLAVGVGAFTSAGPAMLVLAVGAAWGELGRRRVARGHRIVLRVHDGALEVVETRTEKPLARVAFDRLLDVVLDGKTLEKVQRSVRADGMVGDGPSLSVDVARIALLVEDRGGPLPLGEAFSSHAEGVEWLGKIRRFLRSAGWVPQDERPDQAD